MQMVSEGEADPPNIARLHGVGVTNQDCEAWLHSAGKQTPAPHPHSPATFALYAASLKHLSEP